MIKIEKEETFGWEHAVRGARNPMNSWNKSDSELFPRISVEDQDFYKLGPNDHKLLSNLAKAGPDHGKFMRMIMVYVDITAPLYWWKEFDTYKVGTVANSCSTMHKIHTKEFTLEDFSCEHLLELTMENFSYTPKVDVNPITNGLFDDTNGENIYVSPYYLMYFTVKMLNQCREKYIETKKKKYWWQMIQLLPSSYNQKRTVMLNYEVLKNMYHARKNHKLDEWRKLCEWIESLPYSELITGEEK